MRVIDSSEGVFISAGSTGLSPASNVSEAGSAEVSGKMGSVSSGPGIIMGVEDDVWGMTGVEGVASSGVSSLETSGESRTFTSRDTGSNSEVWTSSARDGECVISGSSDAASGTKGRSRAIVRAVDEADVGKFTGWGEKIMGDGGRGTMAP